VEELGRPVRKLYGSRKESREVLATPEGFWREPEGSGPEPEGSLQDPERFGWRLQGFRERPERFQPLPETCHSHSPPQIERAVE
jgi:hypothetical protein